MSGATKTKTALRGKAGKEPKAVEPEEVSEEVSEEVESEEEQDVPVEYHEDGSVTVNLTQALQPYTGKGADMFTGITKLVLREIYAGDMVALDEEAGDMAKITNLAKELSKMPVSFLERLHWEDFARVHGVINTKLGKFLGTSAQQWRR